MNVGSASQFLDEVAFFYNPPNDINIYHVICKMISQDHSQNSASDDDNFDYEFFYFRYHVTCKLLSHSLIVNVLNREIYRRNFNANDWKRKSLLLTSQQKFILELNLKQI